MLIPVSALHNFNLHLEQTFVSESHSQAVSIDLLALKHQFFYRTDDFALRTDNVAYIGNATELQGASKARDVRIKVLGDSLAGFLGSTKRSLHARSNIDHDIGGSSLTIRSFRLLALCQDHINVLGWQRGNGGAVAGSTVLAMPTGVSTTGKGSSGIVTQLGTTSSVDGRFSWNTGPSRGSTTGAGGPPRTIHVGGTSPVVVGLSVDARTASCWSGRQSLFGVIHAPTLYGCPSHYSMKTSVYT